MNKTLIALIVGIVAVAGLIGYTVFGKESAQTHTTGDGHTEARHVENAAHTVGDGHTEAVHAESGATVPHDDSGAAPHVD